MNAVFAFEAQGFVPSACDLVVSLSPEASFDFERRGVPYRILNDYYEESGLYSPERKRAWFHDQWELFAEADAVFQRHSAFCREFDIAPCTMNYLQIKYAMDTINLNGWILERFFNANPDVRNVTLLLGGGPLGEPAPSFFAFRGSRQTVYSNVLKEVCAGRSIGFSEVRSSEKAAAAPGERPSAAGAAKDLLKIPYRYLSYRKFAAAGGTLGPSILFLHHGSFEIDHYIRQAVASGARAFVREGDRLILESSVLRTAWNVGPQPDPPGLESGLRDAAEEFADETTPWAMRLQTMSLWKGADALIRPFFVRYARREALEILRRANAWKPMIEKNGIDVVLARGNTDADSLAVLTAARQLCSKKTVCVQHAPYALRGRAMRAYDTVGFDYIVARDPVTYAYFKLYGREESRLGLSTHYLSHLKAASSKGPKERGKIVYLPKKFHEDIRCWNEFTYPYTWYYEWQRRVLALFAKLSPQIFVYKHVPLQGWAADSSLRYLERLGASNIEVVDEPFFEVLGRYDRVITDFPSGGFFEAAACGKSVLCVQPSYFKINPEAEKLLGRCFASFSTIEQSLSAIEKFVSADPDLYRVDLPLKEMDLAELVSKAQAAPAPESAAAEIHA